MKKKAKTVKKKTKVSLKRRIVDIFILLIFLAGASILSYPTVSNMWNEYRNSRLISDYDQAVSELSKDEYDQLWKDAKEYNAEHTVNTIQGVFNDENYQLSHPYDKVLDPNGDGLMGSIEIPKLDVKLAIYHGLGEDVLQKGAGHVEGTSLPIGGRSTHAAIAAHRGLPSAKLFSDLDQIEKGDIFILKILDKSLAYKVDQIKVVLPSDSQYLAIEEGRDLVTLITCTPYAVNTHRILVRGTRTKMPAEDIQKETLPQKAAHVNPVVLLVIGIVIVIVVLFIMRKIMKHRQHKTKGD